MSDFEDEIERLKREIAILEGKKIRYLPIHLVKLMIMIYTL